MSISCDDYDKLEIATDNLIEVIFDLIREAEARIKLMEEHNAEYE